MAELRQTFRPEFLNRIDDIIVFRALTEQDIEEVTRRMLKTVAGRMETMDIHLDASDEAVKELAKEGFDPRYGARPLRRAIQSKVEDAVAVEDDVFLPTVVINDGRIMAENLRLAGRDENWLRQQLQKRKIRHPRDVFLLSVDENGGVVCQLKENAR